MDADGVQKVKPSAAEVISDGALAIVAGSDTTSSTLSSLFWFLLCRPEAYARLRAEVDALGPDDVMDTTRHSQMPYLNAVMYVSTLYTVLIPCVETKHSDCSRL
jgi:cytochrome P450